MEIQVRFTYLNQIKLVTCKDNEDKSKMFEQFTNQLDDDSKPTHYIYYHEGNKLDFQGKICDDRYLRGKKDIIIAVQKKLRFVKCPECVCNDCIVNLDHNLLTFYGCKYNHTTTKKYDDYIKIQKIEGPELKCNSIGCPKNQENYFKGFYKCFECSITITGELGQSTRGGGQYYCKEHLEEEHKNHPNAKYDKKNYYCGIHGKTFKNYCFAHKKDICDDCYNSHAKCNVKGYNVMEPNIEKLNESLKLMEKNINKLRGLIEQISNRLVEALRVFKRYHYIAKDIIGKYELFNKELKDYKILKSLRNLKVTNIKMNKELTDIITELDTGKRINSLFKIASSQDNIPTKDEKFNYSKENDDDWLEEITKGIYKK